MIIEPHPTLTEFMYMNRKGRNKPSHDSFYCICRYTPDAEKSENMINPECIEIITHLHESAMPPFKTVLRHLVPVISWESPVLTTNSKTIWRCPCLLIHMVQPRFHPCITTVAI